MTDEWERVAETVKRRRTELGLSQRQAARLADDLSPTTWGSLEKRMQPVSPLSAAAMSKALQWTPDSIARILDGGDPEEVAPPAPDLPEGATEAELVQAVRDLTEAVRQLRADMRDR